MFDKLYTEIFNISLNSAHLATKVLLHEFSINDVFVISNVGQPIIDLTIQLLDSIKLEQHALIIDLPLDVRLGYIKDIGNIISEITLKEINMDSETITKLINEIVKTEITLS